MANQVAARLKGDDYQHLYAWWYVLELLMRGKQVRCVTVEDALAGSMDDVTIEHEADASAADEFHQVKYHVDQRGVYSSTSVIAPAKPGETSLLEKFWRSWKLIRARRPERPVLLYLVSNWTWDADDALRPLIEGEHNGIKEEFPVAEPRTCAGKVRAQWQQALKAEDADFAAFVRSLRFRLGFDCTADLVARVAERMEHLGLRSDTPALVVAAGIVRCWVKRGVQAISREELEHAIMEHGLFLPDEREQRVTVYLTTVKDQKFEIEPDYAIDWKRYFDGSPGPRGHQLVDPALWNTVLLPELRDLEARVSAETACRLVRARGLSRLSAWFAFGHCFSEVARYTIEVDQQGKLWRTDAAPSPDFRVVPADGQRWPDGEILDGEGTTVAIGISVTGEIDGDVRKYLSQRTEHVASLLLVRPNKELGRDCLRGAGDAVVLADGVKELARGFAKRWSARRLLVFYFGPLSGACFIGHRFNAVCRDVQIMESLQPGYAPSFLLT